MAFMLSAVEKDPGCKSQILLDGVFVSAASLLKRRREAELEMYPCQSRCCSGTCFTAICTVSPLKLHILLSNQTSLIFSLSRENKTFSTTEELQAPTIASSLRRGLLFCVLSLTRGNCLLSVALYTDQGFYKRICLSPDWHLHELYLERYIQQDASVFVSDCDACLKSKELGFRAEQVTWICQDLSNCASSIKQGHYISFDDRNPTKTGLTGAYKWNGMSPSQTVRVSKMKFWFTNSFVSGFQATYVINGIQKTGPRNRFDTERRRQFPRIFELYEGENVGFVLVFRQLNGLIVHLSIVTDRGRSFSVGANATLTNSQPETLLRHPRESVVGFRGSVGRGLVGFGLVVEVDSIYQKEMHESFKCYVCGVRSSYFHDMELFRRHVDNCILSLVVSRQSTFFHAGKIAL